MASIKEKIALDLNKAILRIGTKYYKGTVNLTADDVSMFVEQHIVELANTTIQHENKRRNETLIKRMVCTELNKIDSL